MTGRRIIKLTKFLNDPLVVATGNRRIASTRADNKAPKASTRNKM